MSRPDDPYVPLPPDVPRGPYQAVYFPPQKGSEFAFFWKVMAAVTAALIVGGISFIGGATWSHNTRITALETYRQGDKEKQDKLEGRVERLENRIK